MSSPDAHRPDAPAFPISFTEFVVLMASLMMIQALGTDLMLPALPAIGRDLGTAHANDAQWVISAYLIGFGASQLVYGPIVDRYGRKPLMLISLTLLGATSILASVASSFTLLLAARVLQGIAGSACRVLVVSIIRDRYVGRQMARVMSLSMMVFLIGPLLAPAIGQAIMLVASWRVIFWSLAGFALLLLLWGGIRLPETLDPANRRPINLATTLGGFGAVLRDRQSIGYTLAGTLTFGALLGFISSCQQIFADALDAPGFFAAGFALSSAALALAALINSRIVERLGTRRVSHGALCGVILVSALHMLWASTRGETLTSFVIFQCLTMFFTGLVGSNFNAIAMEPMGALAGTASALQGSISMLGASLLGAAIGLRFDNSTMPVIEGYLAMAMGALIVVAIVERGRLFHPHHPPQAS